MYGPATTRATGQQLHCSCVAKRSVRLGGSHIGRNHASSACVPPMMGLVRATLVWPRPDLGWYRRSSWLGLRHIPGGLNRSKVAPPAPPVLLLCTLWRTTPPMTIRNEQDRYGDREIRKVVASALVEPASAGVWVVAECVRASFLRSSRSHPAPRLSLHARRRELARRLLAGGHAFCFILPSAAPEPHAPRHLPSEQCRCRGIVGIRVGSCTG